MYDLEQKQDRSNQSLSLSWKFRSDSESLGGEKLLEPNVFRMPRFAHDFSRIPVHTTGIFQPKLAVNASGDVYEQEADRVSEDVLNAKEPRLRLDSLLKTMRAAKNETGATTAPPVVDEALRASGEPLDTSAREFMESRFAHDFSGVRVHTDSKAAKSAEAVNALAYTVGRDVVFAAGRYQPKTDDGRRLLAHELSHVLQQGGAAQFVQREEPTAAQPVEPAAGTENAPPQTAPPAAGIRVANIWYTADGKPIAEKPLLETDRARIAALLARIQSEDPKLYAQIENEDLLLSRAKLPEGNAGRNYLATEAESKNYSLFLWWMFEKTGLDPALGPPPPDNQTAWIAASDEFYTIHSPEQIQDMTTRKEDRVVKATFKTVLLLDLDQIDARQKFYEKEKEKYDNAPENTRGAPPENTQTDYGTLRHEIGHLLFNRLIQYDKNAKELPKQALPEPLKREVSKHSGESIETDIGVLSEFAAEGTERSSEAFDPEKFKEENDPKFGIAGYHDVDGNVQTPSGFGVRAAAGLTLIAAKQIARDLKTTLNIPVFLLTVLKPENEQRLFDVVLLAETDQTALTAKLDSDPALAKYKAMPVVAY